MALASFIPACGHGQHQGSVGGRKASAIGHQAKAARIDRRHTLRQFGNGRGAQSRHDAAQGVQDQPAGMGLQRRVCVQINRVQALQNQQQLSIHILSTFDAL
jgi:hypothetical protein